ncbi:MAG: hypothetical protein ACTSPW_17215 [Promethearchaeota archaeon]
MTNLKGNIIISRLIVLISIIILPIAIFLIYNLIDFHLWFNNDPSLEFWLIKVLCPLVYSISWLFFLIIFATRFAETIEVMDNVISIVPLRLKLFYGMNALIIMFIFVFPLITPIIAVLSFMSMAWRISLKIYKNDFSEKEKIPFFTKFLMLIFAIIPIFCSIIVIPNYIQLLDFIFLNIWIPLLEIIFIISFCLCTALAIGSLFYMFSYSGISEYEQLLEYRNKEKSKTAIRLLEIGLFIFFLLLALNNFEVIYFFYNLGFFIVLFVSVINFFRGKRKDRNFNGHLFGYLLAAVFMGSNLIFFSIEISDFLKITSLLISALIFILIFFYVFITFDEDYLE